MSPQRPSLARKHACLPYPARPKLRLSRGDPRPTRTIFIELCQPVIHNIKRLFFVHGIQEGFRLTLHGLDYGCRLGENQNLKNITLLKTPFVWVPADVYFRMFFQCFGRRSQGSLVQTVGHSVSGSSINLDASLILT